MPAPSLFPKGFWEAPKLTANRVGAGNQQLLQATVGSALTSWEVLEEDLAQLFFALLRLNTGNIGQLRYALGRVYGSVEANSVRLRMIEAAAEVYFGVFWNKPEIKEPFDELMRNIKVAGQRRNEIAHGRIASIGVGTEEKDAEGISLVKQHGNFLFAPSYISGRNIKHHDLDYSKTIALITSTYGYDANDVQGFSYKFSLLQRKIIEYMGNIRDTEFGVPKLIFDFQMAEHQETVEKAERKLRLQEGRPHTPMKRKKKESSPPVIEKIPEQSAPESDPPPLEGDAPKASPSSPEG